MTDHNEIIRKLEWCLQPDQRGHYGWIAEPALEVIQELQAENAQPDQPAQGDGWQFLTNKPDDKRVCLLWHAYWVDPDFNPTGVREGFWGPHPDDPDQECWIVARWNPCHDVWETERADPQPTHRMPMPQPPIDYPDNAHERFCCTRTREALERLQWVLWYADPDSIRIARDDPGMNADWQLIAAAIRRTDGDNNGT